MSDHSFTTNVAVDRTPIEAFEAITNVGGWWPGACSRRRARSAAAHLRSPRPAAPQPCVGDDKAWPLPPRWSAPRSVSAGSRPRPPPGSGVLGVRPAVGAEEEIPTASAPLGGRKCGGRVHPCGPDRGIETGHRADQQGGSSGAAKRRRRDRDQPVLATGVEIGDGRAEDDPGYRSRVRKARSIRSGTGRGSDPWSRRAPFAGRSRCGARVPRSPWCWPPRPRRPAGRPHRDRAAARSACRYGRPRGERVRWPATSTSCRMLGIRRRREQ